MRERERRESERRDSERKESERRESERRESKRRESERRESERIESEKRGEKREYHGLKAADELNQNGRLVGQRENALLDERALDVFVLHENVLLQDLHCEQLLCAAPCASPLRQNHLTEPQNHRTTGTTTFY